MSDLYNPISHKFLWILNLGSLGDCEPELLVSGNYLTVRHVVLTVITVLVVGRILAGLMLL